MGSLSRRSRLKLFAAAYLAMALLAKRYYRNANHVWLVKRALSFVMSRVVPVPIPRVVSGVDTSGQIAGVLTGMGCKRPLIVTDEVLVKFGLVKPCIDSLQAAGCEYSVFDAVVPNPHSELIEQGHEVYKSGRCDSIIAIGGGSPMDTAKIIGAKVANPKPVENYEGVFNVNPLFLKPLPTLIAVPTTAGTGSETTCAALITLKDEHRKVAILDPSLVPSVAILDPQIVTKLPPHITAATGMDALTHAIESYIGGLSSAFTRRNSLSATEKIFRNILKSYRDGSDLQAREQMLNAAFEAGVAFTRANLGNVHAIAHQFGGMFGTPHGEANAMILPHVLTFYLEDEHPGLFSDAPITDTFCDLAVAAGLASKSSLTTPAQRSAAAKLLVTRIAEMNAEMKIPTEVPKMKAADVDEVVARALAETQGSRNSFLNVKAYATDIGYPVPRYMTPKECAGIVANFLPAEERDMWEYLAASRAGREAGRPRGDSALR